MYIFLKPKTRDNRNAPKDPTRPICVLFTDIQASTTLWGEIPEEMSEALDVHHAVIRKLIQKHKCYEVKTIGDCFMIATADPAAGLTLALAIQDVLFDYDWGTPAFEEVYRFQTQDESPEYEYSQVWAGLRVRVGVHYGPAQIMFDESVLGYDYYGTVVNAASRIESVAHGGQVVVSKDVFDAIDATKLGYQYMSKPLGAEQLRGLPKEIELIQVAPARFANRIFPPLRLDKAAPAEEDDDIESQHSGSTVAVGSYPGTLEKEVILHPLVKKGEMSSDAAISLAYNVYYSLVAVMCMTKGEERKKILKDFCKKWHVPFDQNDKKLLSKITLKIMSSVVTLSSQGNPKYAILSQIRADGSRRSLGTAQSTRSYK